MRAIFSLSYITVFYKTSQETADFDFVVNQTWKGRQTISILGNAEDRGISNIQSLYDKQYELSSGDHHYKVTIAHLPTLKVLKS